MHISVLLHSSITGLDIQPGDIVVDGTFGGGGHSSEIIANTPAKKLICVDLDEEAQERFLSNPLLSNDPRALFVHANFKDADSILEKAQCASVNKVLLDLGTSSFQLDTDTRGFSFRSDTPLAMTFSKAGSHTGFSAYDIVNSWEESSIADIIYFYGEDRAARKIAKVIVSARESGPITTSKQLATIIETALPRRGKIHPATKTFQAFRIAVNDELTVIKEALAQWWERLKKEGRIAVITFHSIEDRVVKEWMKEQARVSGRIITKKPIAPSQEEVKQNPRSRSAKLRVIEK